MAEETAISWATSTFNPWIGCSPVSPGCDHCYAETLATSRLGIAWGPHALRRRTSPSNWKKPPAWNRKAAKEGRPWRVFCSSLADVFDNRAPEGAREDLWELIRATPCLTWMLLTKRPGNIAKMLPLDWGHGWGNVWLGATVENQEEAERRIPVLLDVPARLHFLSCEPLLGPLNITSFDVSGDAAVTPLRAYTEEEMTEMWGEPMPAVPRIEWVICGGESGNRARPMHPDWARSLRDQCAVAGVPFHFKQWGGRTPTAGGHLLDGAEHLAVPL